MLKNKILTFNELLSEFIVLIGWIEILFVDCSLVVIDVISDLSHSRHANICFYFDELFISERFHLNQIILLVEVLIFLLYLFLNNLFLNFIFYVNQYR